MAPSRSGNRAAVRWTMRVVPVLIVCIFGVVTYAVIARLCGKFCLLLKPMQRQVKHF